MTRPKFFYDDIGSYPLPDGVTKDWIKAAFTDVESHRNKLYELLRDALQQKLNAGVEVPTYPQFQDMITQFTELIMDGERTEAPLLIREEEAKIHELAAFEELAKDYKEKKGKKLKLRICVTGPIELYYKLFPPPVYTDILSNIATSIGRFIKHAVEEAKNFDVVCVSLDEPSMGLDPRIEEEGIITALELASGYAYQQGIDTQIHLHSPIFYETVCQVEGVTVIGMESAAQPALLKLVDKRQLEQYDKFLRIGIARTDILSMAAAYDELHHTNAFRDKGVLEVIIADQNSPELVTKRLKKASAVFGARIKYVGPDCGLGSFPTQKLAYMVLKNTATGIKAFYSSTK
ncbi:MAG TPA: methionine synthase [Desulfobacteria bacterium]|nr:methionine synthase [Desulfobacteria bacterium]